MKRIALDAIVFDAGTQIRAALNDAVVTDYAERMTDGAEFPPVVLFHNGSHYYMADGFHRALAAMRNGWKEIDAEVKTGAKADALWFALGANKANGHRMTPADKKHAILLALETWPERSANQIAEQIGCGQQYVSRIREEVTPMRNLPDRVTGKDGKSYPSQRPERRASVEKLDRSPAAAESRRQKMRELAADGHTSRQIATHVGLAEETCRAVMRDAGIDVPADRVVTRTKRPDANRVIDQMVMDAENLTADVNLIDFAQVDYTKATAWIDRLILAKRSLDSFIRLLTKESKNNGEAA